MTVHAVKRLSHNISMSCYGLGPRSARGPGGRTRGSPTPRNEHFKLPGNNRDSTRESKIIIDMELFAAFRYYAYPPS